MKKQVMPVEFKILVKPYKVDETDPLLKRAKEAGIALPEDSKDREQMAQQKGTLIAIGGNAFSDWNEPIPKIGDEVMFAKYAGYNIQDDSGEIYRVLNDKDISGFFIEVEELKL